MIRYFFGLLLAAVSLYIASLYESTAFGNSVNGYT